MKNVNSFQVIFYAANAAGGLDASGLDSRFDAGFRVDNFVCVDNSVDDCFNDNSVDNSVNDGFDDSVNDGFDRAAKF
jgi:hypothetical protein